MSKRNPIKRCRPAWIQELESKSPVRYELWLLTGAALLMGAHYTVDEWAYRPEHSLWAASAFWSGLWKYLTAPFLMWLGWRLLTGSRLRTAKTIAGMGLILCAGSALALCIPSMLHSIEAMHLHRFKTSTEKWHWSTFRFYWSYSTPLVFAIGNLMVFRRWRKGAGKGSTQEPNDSSPVQPPAGNPVLKAIAVIAATAALLLTAIHLVLPCLPANADFVDFVRSFLVADRQKADFDFLMQSAFSPGDKLQPLLTHLELADLQRGQFYANLDDSTFRQYVLSPEIVSLPVREVNWRRTLWENFYPRIRNEHDPREGAQIAVRFLRQRVGVDPGYKYRVGVETIWTEQMTDRAGFERIYVATLRSVGIASRLDASGKAEILEKDQWRPAPPPLVYSFEKEKFPVPDGGLTDFK